MGKIPGSKFLSQNLGLFIHLEVKMMFSKHMLVIYLVTIWVKCLIDKMIQMFLVSNPTLWVSEPCNPVLCTSSDSAHLPVSAACGGVGAWTKGRWQVKWKQTGKATN